jgi:hypothetical protein
MENNKGITELNPDSDLMIAIKIGREKRDEKINDLVDLLKSGIQIDKRLKVDDLITTIFKQNEGIKLCEDAVIAVRVYKYNQKMQ